VIMKTVKNVTVQEIVINAQVPLNHKQKNVLQTVISDGGNTKETVKFVLTVVNIVNPQHSAKNVMPPKSYTPELAKLLAQLDITLKTEFASKHPSLSPVNSKTKILQFIVPIANLFMINHGNIVLLTMKLEQSKVLAVLHHLLSLVVLTLMMKLNTWLMPLKVASSLYKNRL
jgi:hypothetical protein